jgi:hypothetical protein
VVAFVGILALSILVLCSQSPTTRRELVPIKYRRSTVTLKQVKFNLKPGASNNLATSTTTLPNADLQWHESAASEYQPTLSVITEECEEEESRNTDEGTSHTDAAVPKAPSGE